VRAELDAAELVDGKGRVIGAVRASLWKKAVNGRMVDWGGELLPEGGMRGIGPGVYVLRLPNGAEGRIFFDNIFLGKDDEGEFLRKATFVGDGAAPV
jgi:hypothetical protein